MRSSIKGFTLIETLVYIALFGIILTGVIVTSYPLITGADKLSLRTTTDGESAFVSRKVAWALSSLVEICTPSAGFSGNTLIVRTAGPDCTTGPKISLRQGVLTQNSIEVSKDGGITWLPLTASRVTFSNFSVRHTSPAGGVPRSLSVEFDANGVHFGPNTRYIYAY